MEYPQPLQVDKDWLPRNKKTAIRLLGGGGDEGESLLRSGDDAIQEKGKGTMAQALQRDRTHKTGKLLDRKGGPGVCCGWRWVTLRKKKNGC